MKIDVFLNSQAFTTGAKTYNDNYVPNKKNLKYIGTVEAINLEAAYRRLQHGFYTSEIPNQRSISVGDVLKANEKYYLVQFMGFKELTWEELELAEREE